MDEPVKPKRRRPSKVVAPPQESPERLEEQRLARFQSMADSLVRLRKEAIDGRKSSGIETQWEQDEEHYAGIDDKNRHTLSTDWNSKPPGRSLPAGVKNESIEFPNITRAYVDAAAARVGDIILPTDDRPWSLKNTPVADLEEKAKGRLPAEVVEGMQASGVPPEKQAEVAQIERQQAEQALTDAREKAEQASTHIEDWMIEGQWHAEMRKCIHDACRVGSAVLKGPTPKTTKRSMWKDGKLSINEETKPVSRRIPCWNFYPDPACGDSIHNGGYTWEVDFITEHMLLGLKKEMLPVLVEGEPAKPAYIHAQIDECIKEGPKKAAGERKTADGKKVADGKLYEIWYYHGFAAREDLMAAGCECPAEMGELSVPCIFVLVNDRVIKAALNPLDTGDFPYDVLPWKRRLNMPWGDGVSREGRTAQRIVTAATRVMLTNAGRAAGPIIARKRGVVVPADGSDEFTPWKLLDIVEEEGVPVGDLIKIFEIPDRQASLQAIINFGLKMMEDTTGLPMLLQGQVGSAPDTLGGQQLAERNANSVLRRIAREVDDSITEPHLRRYYTYFLMYGPDEKKGDFILDARGSTDLVEREIYKNEVAAMLQASLNPAFGLDPRRTMKEHLRITKKRPVDFQFTDEEFKAMQDAQNKQAPDPAIEAAKIRAEVERYNAEMENKSREAVADAQLKERIMEFAEKRGMNLDSIKADLAKLVMTIKVQKEESDRQREHDTRKHVDKTRTDRSKLKPAVEPPGQAEPGMAFTQ